MEYNADLEKDDKPQGVVVSGTVRRPDGTPLAGAAVAITYPLTDQRNQSPPVHIRNGTLEVIRGIKSTRTDASGRFRLTREPDPAGRYFAVVVVHPEYYAEADRAAFEADPTIRANPWGRIEGVARAGSQPAAGAVVRSNSDRLGTDDVPSLFDNAESTTDDQGRFVLERVVPGDVRVVRGSGDATSILVQVKHGETARAELGGLGRPVIARIAPPAGFDPNGDYTVNSRVEVVSDRPNIPYPTELLARRDRSMIDWARRWWASAEGHEYRRNWFRFGPAKLQSDGTILVDDVPPGEYRLNLMYTTDPFRGIPASSDRIAFATKQFTIPPIPDGRSDEPFDLGVLRARPKQTLQVGQPAPAFDLETLDGRRVKLADFRGKFLLLDFWATWCGPCLAEIPELKAVHDRFGKDPRFAMLSLSLDAEKDAPRKFVAEKALSWAQGFLGQGVEGGPTDAYHVETIPAVFLIGPDGTLKAQGLRGDSIAGAVSQALQQP